MQIILCIKGSRKQTVLYHDFNGFINLSGEIVLSSVNMQNITNAIRILFKYYPNYRLYSRNDHGTCIDYNFQC